MLNADISFPFYTELNGQPLQNGSIYFGAVGQNPLTSPQTVYWDSDGTQPASQPIKTVNGRPSRNGSPARLWITGDYSRLVQDSQGRQILFEPSVSGLPLSLGVTQSGETIIATAAQQVFTLSQFRYSPGSHGLLVSVNGLELSEQEYTEDSTSQVTLASGVEAGDEVHFATPIPISMGVFGSSVNIVPTGATPRVDSVQSILTKVVKRPQDNGDVTGDATTAMQNAINALEASGAELLELDIGDLTLRIDGTLTNTQPIRVVGQGVFDIDDARPTTQPTRGSWLIHNNASGPLWEINQQTSKNCGMEKVGIFQTGHPAPGAGWAPAVRDWVIRAENTNGTVHMKQVHFHNVYQGILCDQAHRPMFEDITGQFFYRGVKFDRIYDIGKCDGFRTWTYWSEDSSVLSWTQANAKTVTLGRVDGLWLDRVFAFGHGDVLYCGPGAVSGSARVINVGGIYADFCKRALVVDNGVTHVSVNSLFHLGQAWPASPTSALAGSCGVEIVSGSNSLVQISNYYGVLSDAASVKIGGTFNQVWIDSPLFEQYDFSASGAGPVQVASSNLVFLGDTAHAVNYAGASTPLITGAAAGILKATLSQQFLGGQATNKIVAAANGPGQLATLTAEGEANAGVAIVAQTNGTVNVGAAANVLSFYGGPGAARQTGVPVTAAGIHAALTALNLITP